MPSNGLSIRLIMYCEVSTLSPAALTGQFEASASSYTRPCTFHGPSEATENAIWIRAGNVFRDEEPACPSDDSGQVADNDLEGRVIEEVPPAISRG